MCAFSYILSSFFPDINIKEAAYFKSHCDQKLVNTNFIDYSYLNSLLCNPEKIICKIKYTHIANSILNNIFISKVIKDKIFEKFSKTQNVYFNFCKLARIFKMKRANVYDINTDLCMVPLTHLKENILIHIYDDKPRIKYIFRMSDIINIINASLSCAPDFFVEPTVIKNPYTNISFSTSQLYNIYFSIKYSTYNMPILFQQYFLQNFDIHNYTLHNEVYIRDIAIKNFVSNGESQKKYEYILEMIKEYSFILKSIAIHSTFPSDKIVSAFEKYLIYYLLAKYSLQPMLRFNSKRTLRQKLALFNKFNPTYGRKIYYKNTKNIYNNAYQFNSLVPNLEQNESYDFTSNNNNNNIQRPEPRLPYNYTFVDTVFTDKCVGPREQFLMGISDMQSVLPPLSSEDNIYDQIPENIRQSLDNIIDNINSNTVMSNEPSGFSEEDDNNFGSSSDDISDISDIGENDRDVENNLDEENDSAESEPLLQENISINTTEVNNNTSTHDEETFVMSP